MTEDRRNRLTEPVPWFIFAWAVVITTALFASLFGLFSSVSAKVEQNEAKEQEILVQLSAIQADLKNLEYLIKQTK